MTFKEFLYSEYAEKQCDVIVISNNTKYVGKYAGYTTNDDNFFDEDIDEYSIDIDFDEKCGMEFYESQVESISILQ